MKVISVPPGLRWAIAMLFVTVPLAALEAIIVVRAPWWRLPFRNIEAWCAGVLLGCLVLAVGLAKGSRLSYRVTAGAAYLWSLLSAWVAIRMHHPSLGFFTAFQLLFFMVLLSWLRREFGRSFFDPRLAWFQGLPNQIPGLSCELTVPDALLQLKVNRLDTDGAFVFTSGRDRKKVPALKANDPAELAFSFRQKTVRCAARAMRLLEHRNGAGFRFVAVSPDQRKELGDFIELLKGEGYVD